MNEEELQARLAQQQAMLAQTQQLAQQYGLAPQQASQWMQVYNQLSGSGRFPGTMAEYFAQRAQEGQVQAPGNQFPTPPPPGLLDPPVTTPPPDTGRPPPPPRGDGDGRTPRPPYQPPDNRPDIPTIPTLPPPPRGDQGAGGPGRGPDYGGAGPGVSLPPNISDTLASFGYMRGPNGEILPQMLQGGWSPYQQQPARQTPQGFTPQGAGGLQLPQLGYDPNQQGYSWFTPPPQQAPVPGAGEPPAQTNPALLPPTTGTPPGRGGPGGPGGPSEMQMAKMGLLGPLGATSLPPSLRGLLG